MGFSGKTSVSGLILNGRSSIGGQKEWADPPGERSARGALPAMAMEVQMITEMLEAVAEWLIMRHWRHDFLT